MTLTRIIPPVILTLIIAPALLLSAESLEDANTSGSGYRLARLLLNREAAKIKADKIYSFTRHYARMFLARRIRRVTSL